MGIVVFTIKKQEEKRSRFAMLISVAKRLKCFTIFNTQVYCRETYNRFQLGEKKEKISAVPGN